MIEKNKNKPNLPNFIDIKEIERIKNYAKYNLISYKSLIAMYDYGKPGYKGPIPAGINPNYTIKTSNGYCIAFNIEHQGKPENSLWVKHLAISKKGEKIDKDLVKILLFYFDFIEKDFHKLVCTQTRRAFHILEPIDKTWKQFMGTIN